MQVPSNPMKVERNSLQAERDSAIEEKTPVISRVRERKDSGKATRK